MQFTVNGIDFSDHIPSGSYAVSNNDIFEEWVDGNYKSHRCKTAEKVSGDFDMFFKTETDFAEFRSALSSVKGEDLTYPVVLTCNNTGEDKEIRCFIDFELVRSRDAFWHDYFERFNVSIREA